MNVISKDKVYMKKRINKVRDLMNGYKASYLLITAARLGVFEILSEGTTTSKNIGSRLGIENDKIELILNALVALELIEKEEDVYSLNEYKSVLQSNSTDSQVGYFNYAFSMTDKWKNLIYTIKKETVLDEHNDNEEAIKEFLNAMNTNAISQAMYLADKYNFASQSIIDVGAGYGTYSMIIADKFSDAKFEVFDLPIVEKILIENITEAKLNKQISVISGDYRKNLPEKKYDAVFLFAIIHQEDEKEVERLLKNIYDRLNEGGKLYLSSYFLEENKTEPYFAVMFGLEMLVRYGKGKVYTHNEINAKLINIGYKEIARDDSMPGPATLYIASK